MSNGLKIDNIKPAGTVVTPLNTAEIKTNDEGTSKDVLKSTEASTQEGNESTIKKHLVTYIGSGEFVDAYDHKWYNGNEKTYSDEEFKDRRDLKFMIKYGAMKHTVVTV